ncbi:hypothetical protein Hokovirus_1_7 [Hokovirus HKV1]|uniref:Uncharacterized protein n=1 Tax=Hokovirus HKV1 TaxID=1977638 RepID=A0A1V0SER2_9VIRU|nr:hypothetical protein Hokovirus_1_7 [Hokovirus HKV1]
MYQPNSRHQNAACNSLTHIEGSICPYENCYFNEVLLSRTVSSLLKKYDWAKHIFGHVKCNRHKHAPYPCGLYCKIYITQNCNNKCHDKGMVCTYVDCHMRKILEEQTLSFVLDKAPFIIINNCEELTILKIANLNFINEIIKLEENKSCDGSHPISYCCGNYCNYYKIMK